MSNVADFTLPEVQVLHQKPRFFKEGNADFIEISYVGSKDTMIRKVCPQHMASFRDEWNAYCDGQPVKQRSGTPLTDLPSIKDLRVEHYTSRNVQTLEELAALTDAQCQALGHGVLTDREHTRKLLTQRTIEQTSQIRDKVTKMSADIGPVPSEKYASAGELAATNAKIDALADNVAALVAVLSEKKKLGRPKKEAE